MLASPQVALLPKPPAPIPILELPSSRIPEQPPPFNKLLFCLNKNITSKNIHICDPITNDNVLDSELAWAGVTSLNQLRQVLTTPFNSPKSILDREDWLHFTLDIIVTIHEGLNLAQLSAPDHSGTMKGPSAKLADISNGFANLNASELDLVSTIEEVLDWIYNFFIHHNECYPANSSSRLASTLCYRCVESSHFPFTSADNQDKITSILLSIDFNAHATWDTLLNQAIHEVHEEVDKWHATQQNHIPKAIMDTITSAKEPTSETLAVTAANLDERLHDWIGTKREELHAYARGVITNDVGNDVIDQHFQKLIEEHVFQCKRELKSQVEIWSATLQAAFDKELASTTAAFQMTLESTKLQMKTLDTDIEAACLKNHNTLTSEIGHL
jgi:hypothetical protein